MQESMSHHPTDQTNKVRHLSLDLLSFDKGIHKNRDTDAQRIIREIKREIEANGGNTPLLISLSLSLSVRFPNLNSNL